MSSNAIPGRKLRKELRKAGLLGPNSFPTSNKCNIQADSPKSSIMSNSESAPKLYNSMNVSNLRINPGRIDKALTDDRSDNKQSVRERVESYFSGSEINSKSTSPFPDLIILFTNYCNNNYNPYNPIDGIKLVNRCLKEFKYGSLTHDVHVSNSTFHVSVSYEGNILAKGQGSTRDDAILAAGAHLTHRLRTTNFSIEPKSSYFTKKRIPNHVLKVDDSQSHIYKVVCLMAPCVPLFPFRLSGSIDYVTSEDDLWLYIENHINSSDADLYVLNIDSKLGYNKVRELFRRSNIFGRRLLGSSNKGIVVSRKENISKIFEDLKKCGGENIKYRLIPPGGKLQGYSYALDKNACDDEELECGEEQIEIPQWIADHLILMDYFNLDGTLVKPAEYIRLSVVSCPDLGEFIIEKRFNSNTSIYTCEVLIDKKLVGRARGYSVKHARDMAAENALKNLRNSCLTIQMKPSYFGCNGQLPTFLTEENSPGKNIIFRVVEPEEATSEREFGKVLQQFKNSKLEDLFFLQNFSYQDIQLVLSMAKDMKLQARQIGSKYACIYKKRRPMDICKELRKNGGENEKYKLIIPPRKLVKLEPAKKQNHKDSQLKNLFDFDEPNINQDYDIQSLPNQVESDTSSQTISSRQIKSSQFNKIPFDNKINPNCASTEDSRKFEYRGWHSKNNQISYSGVPNIRDERISSYSQRSYKNQRALESRDDFNGGSEGWNSRKNKRSYCEGPGSREGDASRYSEFSQGIQSSLEPRHGFNEGSDEWNSEGPGSREEHASGYSESSQSIQRSFDPWHGFNEGSEKWNSGEPLTREEHASRYSESSQSIQRSFESRHGFNEGSEKWNSGEPLSREEHASRYSESSQSIQRSFELRHGFNEGSEKWNSGEPLSKEKHASRYSESSQSIQRSFEPRHGFNEGSERYAFNENTEGCHSRNSKRSYFEGPGSREEETLRCSQFPHNIQSSLEPRHHFNKGSNILHNQSFCEEQDERLFQRREDGNSTSDSRPLYKRRSSFK